MRYIWRALGVPAQEELRMLRTLSQRAIAAESACRRVARVGRAPQEQPRGNPRPGVG